MTKAEILEQMKTAVLKMDWYDIVQLVKKDDSDYALHLLATITIKHQEQLNHVREWVKEIF